MQDKGETETSALIIMPHSVYTTKSKTEMLNVEKEWKKTLNRNPSSSQQWYDVKERTIFWSSSD